MKTQWLKLLFATLWLSICTLGWSQTTIPAAGQRVNDVTKATFTGSQVEALAQQLERVEEQTGARLLVLVIPSLEGETIEAYSQRVFEAWRPGRTGIDDGALLVLSRGDRKMRIHLGRGLESRLPYDATKRITSSYMVPAFKAGNFAQGFQDAISAMEERIRMQRPQPVNPTIAAVQPTVAPVVEPVAPTVVPTETATEAAPAEPSTPTNFAVIGVVAALGLGFGAFVVSAIISKRKQEAERDRREKAEAERLRETQRAEEAAARRVRDAEYAARQVVRQSQEESTASDRLREAAREAQASLRASGVKPTVAAPTSSRSTVSRPAPAPAPYRPAPRPTPAPAPRTSSASRSASTGAAAGLGYGYGSARSAPAPAPAPSYRRDDDDNNSRSWGGFGGSSSGGDTGGGVSSGGGSSDDY